MTDRSKEKIALALCSPADAWLGFVYAGFRLFGVRMALFVGRDGWRGVSGVGVIDEARERALAREVSGYRFKWDEAND